MVGHGVGSARIDNGAGVHVSAPDLGLSVPVRELDEVEIPKRELQGEIRLIISGSEGLNPALNEEMEVFTFGDWPVLD